MGRPKSDNPLSNKESCKKYREKNKEALKKKERERKKTAREYEKYLFSGKYQKRLFNDRIRAREYRKRKNEEPNEQTPNISNPPDQTSSTSSQESSSAASSQTPFRSKQSFCRSISRAEKNLPNSPRKKTAVIGNLARKYNLKIELKETRGRKAKVLTEEQEEWLIDYLERPEMTYTNPGRKDNVYIGKIDGEKQYLQKRYLLWTLRDALGILNNQEDGFHVNFEEDLSFGVFYRFMKHKKQFIYQRDIPDTSCLCEVCENASMMAKVVRKQKSGHPTNAHDIVEKYSCNSDDPTCMKGSCDHCRPFEILRSWDADDSSSNETNESSDDESDYISFTKRIREDKKIKKATKCLSHQEFYEEWKEMVITLKNHIHRKRVQVTAYNTCKTNLQQGEALVHVDYSESYKNKQQDEIQSAYFGQSCFSLFTACVYHLDDSDKLVKRPITVVSESNDHSRIAALNCIDFVIREIERSTMLKKVILWSDGCASQFRSRFVGHSSYFFLLLFLNQSVSLNC